MNTDEPTSTPHVGCAAMSTFGRCRISRPHDELLQVAAGKALGLGRRPAAANVEGVDAAAREGVDHLRAQQTVDDHPLAVRGEKRVVRE